MKLRKYLLLFATLMTVPLVTQAKVDKKFHIYLCIGQSNMEAGARPAEQDKDFNDPRFQFMAAVDMPRYNREKGNWYTAVPPICRQENNMGPVDFFGRKMIEQMPEDYRIGVINVSVAGAKIELWDKDGYKEYIDGERDWMKNIVAQYDGNPYQRLVEMAKLAQKDGVIKGILIHQGESNSDDPEWPAKVKKIYTDLCKDLKLKQKDIYLLAGELKSAEQGGVCAAFNDKILPHLHEILPNAYAISSIGCQSTGDQFHFNTEGMRLMGYRMAEKMLQLQGFKEPAKRTMTVNPDMTTFTVSPTLSGIFFEDINQSLDGGICAQLIQNYSFQCYNVPDGPANEFSQSDSVIFGWTTVATEGSKGSVLTVSEKPLLSELPRYYDYDPNDKYDDEQRYIQYCARIEIDSAGKGFGIAANGYGITAAPEGRARGITYSNNTQTPSIAAVKDVTYNLSLYLAGKQYGGNVSIWLEDARGSVNSNIYKVSNISDDWTKYTAELKALRSVDCRLAIVADAPGTLYLDFVTLMPEDSQLWQNGKYGPFRKDMMEALAALNPKFMRFPGGCASEGPNYFGQPFWKNSIGPREERIGFRNHWGYWTSQYVGFYEYLLMAESLGATPLPVLNNGVTCQFAGHQYIAPLDTEADRKRFHDIFVKDALDFIEFCNGSVNSEWGSVRAKMGHPAPFNLKYLGIGNENQGKEFWERFDIMYNEIQKAYPEIIIVSTAGAAADGREFNANMKEIDAKYQNTVVDEHYYRGDDWFYSNGDRYNADKERGEEGIKYDRERPTRVFVGEFANSGANNAYSSAMAEAAYWTSLERNSDMVIMAAYAPLFCKKGYNKWNSNLIWFDNRGLWRSCNYYYHMLFSKGGDKLLYTGEVMDGAEKDEKVYTSSTVDSKTGEVFIKFVNADAFEKVLTLTNEDKHKYNVSIEFITSPDVTVKNQGDNNYYSGAQGVRNVSYLEAVVPHSATYGTHEGSTEITLPENSVGVIHLEPYTWSGK